MGFKSDEKKGFWFCLSPLFYTWSFSSPFLSFVSFSLPYHLLSLPQHFQTGYKQMLPLLMEMYQTRLSECLGCKWSGEHWVWLAHSSVWVSAEKVLLFPRASLALPAVCTCRSWLTQGLGWAGLWNWWQVPLGVLTLLSSSGLFCLPTAMSALSIVVFILFCICIPIKKVGI